jgi:hypothetical protein
MEDQVIDVEASSVVDEQFPSNISMEVNHEDKIKTAAEIRNDLNKLKELNRELKKIKRYMKSPIHAIRQMDAKAAMNQ